MPLQSDGDMTCPWADLADAHAEADEALRTDDADRQRLALDRLEGCRDDCAALGVLLFKYAMERGGLAFQKKVAQVFGQLAVAAFDRGKAAMRRADHALDGLDAVKQRLRELERKLDDKTFGVGQPGRVA
jgi:hypothetical protein